MKNGSGHQAQIAIPNGATQTDLRLTRHPANTPRAKLHRLAAVNVRAADELRRTVDLSQKHVEWLREFARRCAEAVKAPRDRGEYILSLLCKGLEEMTLVLTRVDLAAVTALCEGLTLTLVQLEAAENSMLELKAELARSQQDTRYARGDVTQLRTLLAAAHAEAAKKEAAEQEKENWGEPTARRELTELEKQVIDDPDAR